MNIRFLILWLALGLLAAGGCTKLKEMYEIRGTRSRCARISISPPTSLRFTRLPIRG